MLQSCLSHTMAMSPLAIKSQHRFGTRTGGEGSPWPGEAQETPDSARRMHGQRRARPGLAATRETKQKPSLAPGVQQTQSTTGNTPVPRSSMLGWRRIQPPWQGAPSPHKPGDIRAPSRHPLSLPPPLVPQTLISHPMAPCKGEEVPEEEGFPPAHSGCPSHCRASRILADAAVPARAHLPSRFRVEGTQRCHSSALKGVSTERSPHCESWGSTR